MKRVILIFLTIIFFAMAIALMLAVPRDSITNEPVSDNVLLLLRVAGLIWFVAAIGCLYGAFRKPIWLYFRSRSIPMDIRDNYCVRCGRPKSYCACEVKYCPKCKKKTHHNPVEVRGEEELPRGMIQVKEPSYQQITRRMWRCYECLHVHNA